MTILPETDLTLSLSYPAARRFLHWLTGDDKDRFQTSTPADDALQQQKRSSFTWVVADDAVINGKPRGYRVLSQRLVGTFDEVADRLAAANIENRVGVFVQLDTATMLIAHYAGTPQHGQGGRMHGWEGLGAAQPSTRLATGHDRETWLWLVSDAMPIELRNDVGFVLQHKHGAKIETGTTALVRVPGFYARDGAPFMVMGHGAEDGGMKAKTYSPKQLHDAFLGTPAEVVETPSKTAGKQSEAEELALRKRRFDELVGKGFSVEQATETVIAEREMQARIDRAGARVDQAAR
jgi:hypothetical protein